MVDKSLFPTSEQAVEELSYKDENEFTWKLSRVQNGFFITFTGDPHFMNSRFVIELDDGNLIMVNNTNCIFVSTTDFEVFVHFRDILKNGYTDDIWDSIEEFLLERFSHDPSLLESEIVEIK